MNAVMVGDCRDRMRELPDASVDSIVTDPPYELGFMGKTWDASGIAYDVAMWKECLRVLKPGGHLLAFGGTRTYHRMACAIEDAGFEIRDSVHWMYGSGFPKSLDVSKAIDKAAGAKRGACDEYAPDTLAPDPEDRDICTTCFYRGVDHTVAGTGDHVGNIDFGMKNRCSKCDLPYFSANPCKCPKPLAVTDDAKDWSGWGTALKPAHEPIVVARKPLVGTVAANVLQHGTGALNIDGNRVSGDNPSIARRQGATNHLDGGEGKAAEHNASGRMVSRSSPESFRAERAGEVLGRWPANVVLTHSADCQQVGMASDTFGGGAKATSGFVAGYEHDGFVGQTVSVPLWECVDGCPVAELDQQSGPAGAAAPASGPTYSGHRQSRSMAGAFAGHGDAPPKFHADKGGASRFFTNTEFDPLADAAPFLYVAKAGKKERNAGLDELPERSTGAEYRPNDDGSNGLSSRRHGANTPRANHHPTVKPVSLMRWLVRLVTPPNGTVLDPFLGSGTTAVAAIMEGFDWVGCEMNREYLPIIEGRVVWAHQSR